MSIADAERLMYEFRLEREIRRVYEEARDDIDAKIEEFNRKFKIKEQIHLKDVSEGRWTQEQYDAWLRGQVFQSDQWASKKRQIEETLFNANSIATKMVNDQRTGLFSFNANYQAYMLEHTAGVNFGFQLYDSATVARLIKDNPQVLPQWKIDEPKDYLWNGKIVNNAIRQGIIQGERLDQIAKRLSNGLVTQNKNKMLTFARTGMTEAQNAGRQTRLLEAEGMGIKVHKEWMATLDEHTRWQHADLDGQKQPVDKPFKIDMYTIRYPGDPQAHPSMVYNCRCTLVGDLDDYPSEYERYDNINGVPIENMTYREWEKAKGVSYSKSRILGDNMFGFPYNEEISVPTFDQVTGELIEHMFTLSKEYKHPFPDGSASGIKGYRDADVYTLDNGTKIFIPSDLNMDMQSMNPADLIQSYYALPDSFTSQIQKSIYVLDYRNTKDEYWAKKYNMPDFRSYATGGRDISFYAYTDHDYDYVTRTFAHEGGHYIDRYSDYARGMNISAGHLWEEAMKADLELHEIESPTSYGKVATGEDFAESIAEYMMHNDFFVVQFPNRAKIIEEVLGYGKN